MQTMQKMLSTALFLVAAKILICTAAYNPIMAKSNLLHILLKLGSTNAPQPVGPGTAIGGNVFPGFVGTIGRADPSVTFDEEKTDSVTTYFYQYLRIAVDGFCDEACPGYKGPISGFISADSLKRLSPSEQQAKGTKVVIDKFGLLDVRAYAAPPRVPGLSTLEAAKKEDQAREVERVKTAKVKANQQLQDGIKDLAQAFVRHLFANEQI